MALLLVEVASSLQRTFREFDSGDQPCKKGREHKSSTVLFRNKKTPIFDSN
jgi:hypothetical protein